jgi:hypothetical protein
MIAYAIVMNIEVKIVPNLISNRKVENHTIHTMRELSFTTLDGGEHHSTERKKT